jgi:hypothetical protein
LGSLRTDLPKAKKGRFLRNEIPCRMGDFEITKRIDCAVAGARRDENMRNSSQHGKRFLTVASRRGVMASRAELWAFSEKLFLMFDSHLS